MSTQPFAEAVQLNDYRAPAQTTQGETPLQLEDAADLPVTLALEVGRTQIPIRGLLQLTAGSVIELDREVGDAFDVLVNGRLLAFGEAVMVNDKCGVRLTDVIRPEGRSRHTGS